MENFPLGVKPERYYAKTIHDRIEAHIKNLMDDLKEDEDLLVEVPSQNRKTIAVSFFGFRNPSFIIVEGNDNDDNFVSALLPQDNIQVIVTIMKKESDKRREIGFQSKDI